jgi:hypothetical protein
MPAQRPQSSEVILTRIDHDARKFYQYDPSPNWPQPAYRLEVTENDDLKQFVLYLASNMSGLLNEEYRLIVGHILIVEHGYEDCKIEHTSALGQQMVWDWDHHNDN